MLSRRFYAAIMALLLVSLVSGEPVEEDRKVKNACLIQESTKDITQGGREVEEFYKQDYKRDKNVVRRITGEMSNSRKMGIGVLLVLIGSVLYAGFNWNDRDPF